LVGLGVAAPGPLDPQAGVVLAAPMLHGWHDIPIARLLRDRLGLDVVLENDANAAALGEWRHGAGRGVRSMVFATVSTGIGGGIIVDGRLLHGLRGLAGEIGHMVVCDNGPSCACGSAGCWETLASGTALAAAARSAVARGEAPRLAALAAGEAVTGRHIERAAREGDGPALNLLAAEARWLAVGLANLLHLYSPERIVLGGGVMACFDLLRGDIEHALRTRAMPAYRDVPVLAAELGGRAGLIGAASLVL
jgi:glucokinase